MPIPWGVIIALFVLGLAYLIKHFLERVLEDQKPFTIMVVAFFAIYIIAAVAIGTFNPFKLVSSQAYADEMYNPSLER